MRNWNYSFFRWRFWISIDEVAMSRVGCYCRDIGEAMEETFRGVILMVWRNGWDAISLVECREGNIFRARLPLKYSAMQYSSWKVDEIFRGAISFVQYYRNIANVMDEIFRGVISIISYQRNISQCNIDNVMLSSKYSTVQYPSWKVIDEIFHGAILSMKYC